MNIYTSTKKILYFLSFLLLSLKATPATINSNGTGGGNWNTGGTWSGGSVPTAGSDVVIQNGDNVMINANVANNLNSITISATGTLTINTNAVTFSVTAGGTKMITVNGLLTMSATAATANQLKTTNMVVASGGTFQNSCGLATAASVTNFTVSNGGTYNYNAVGSGAAGSSTDLFGGATTISLGATSLVNITNWGVASQAPPALPTATYGNLTFNPSTTWSGSLAQGGTLTNIQGNFTIGATGGTTREFRMGSASTTYTVNIGGNLNVSGGILSLIGSGGSAGGTAITNVSGNVNVSGTGILDLNSNQAATGSILNIAGNYNGSNTGIIQNSKSVTTNINLSGNLTLNNTSTFNLINTNFNIVGSGNQTITGNNNLISVRNFNDTTKTTGNITLATNTPITFNNSGFIKNTSSSNQFIDGGNTITALNNINMGGSAAGYNLTGTLLFTAASGTQKTENNPSGSSIVASLNNVTITNTGTGKVSFMSGSTASTVTINGNLIVNTATVTTVTLMTTSASSGNHTFNIGGNFTNTTSSSLTKDATTIFTFNGSSMQTISSSVSGGEIFPNVTIAKSGTALLASAITINTNLAITSGTLDCGANQITGNASGLLTMSSGTTLLIGSTGSSTTVLFPSNFTTAHTTLNANSTVTYQVAGAQTISNIPTYGNFIVSGSGTKTLAGSITVKGNTTISSGTLDCSTFQLVGLAGKSFTMNANTNLILGSTSSATAVSFPTNYLAGGINLDDASTVTYQSNANQTISATPPTYGNLILSSGSSSTTKTPAGILSIDGSLTINTNTTLDVTSANSYGIFLNGSWNNNGTFNAQAGTVTLSGTSSQSIGGSATTTFYNLTSNNAAGVSLSSAQNLSGSLLLNAGVFNTNSKTFTLLATVNGSTYTTGNIGVIDPSADITGNITVQQYGARNGYTGWALLGTPIVSSLTFADWNDNFTITCPTCPDGSGPGGPFTSIDYYDETQVGTMSDAAKYVAISNITDAITPGLGYWVYLGNNYPATTNIVFDVKGTVARPNKAAVNLPLTYTNHGSSSDDGWNLISNPLPSPISWAALRASASSVSNIDDAIYAYNTALNGGVGGYAQYVAGVSSPAVGAGGIGDNIAMGQAFYVHLTGSTTLNPAENQKINANPDFLKQVASTQSYKPVARLFLDNGASHDEAAFHFDPAATIHFEKGYDAYKVLNDPTQPYIAGISDAQMLSISGLPNTQNTSSAVKVITSTSGTFTISLGGNPPTGICINLYDAYTGITTNMVNSNYICTLYDTTTTARFTLSFGTSALAATTNITQPVCSKPNGGLITAVGNNAGPWNYTWRDANGNIIKTTVAKTDADSITQLNGGTYIVEITSTGQCDYFTQTLNVNTVINPVAQCNLSADTLYLPYAVENFYNTSANATNYQWDFGDGNGTSMDVNPIYVYQGAGIYTVTMVANSNTACNDTTHYVVTVINTATGISTVQNSGIALLNNGADLYTVAFNLSTASNTTISLYDVNGHVVYQNKLANVTVENTSLSTSNLASGLYLLKIDMLNKDTKTFKLIKP
jgi:hypothetical protein